MERTNSMRKGVIKGIVLVAVFIVTMVITSILTHQNNIDLTTKMSEPTLPVISLEENGTKIDELYGYTKEMDGTGVRDAIAPLGEDLTLPIDIKTYQSQVEAISYQVRTIDMERLIQEDKIESFSQKDGVVSEKLQFENILEEDKEYMLILTLQCDGKEVYYYTRIIRESGYHVQEAVDFVLDFHEKTFDKQQANSLATYLEPNTQEDNTSLQKVTIHSSLNQVSWADFTGERVEKPIPSIKEIGTSYNTIVLNYVLMAAGENGEVEYYNVEEYYRVRYGNNRMYLLNYERTMNEIFRGESDRVTANGISLGIRSKDVEYKANEKGSVIAFVQEGELWSYSSDDNRLSKVYSFRGAEGIDDRENNPQHDIKIIKIDETGSMDFVVYGYMNRGNHEGNTGIAVYHYDGVGNTIEEELFIPSDKSYEMLKAEWGDIFYVSDGNVFYLLAGDSLYSINLYTRESKKVLDHLEGGRYAVSETGRYIAWQDSDTLYNATTIKVMDLEGEEIREVQAGEGEYLQPIGFVQNDFIYGAARQGDVVVDSAGNTQFPMCRVQILDEKGEVVKDYAKDGYYITKAYVEDETIYLNRVYQNGAGAIPAEQDTIKNQQLEAERNITVDTSQLEQKQTIVEFTFAGDREELTEAPQIVVPKEILVKEDRSVTLNTDAKQEIYYVYSAGKIVKATPFVAEAVTTADSSMGVVIGDKQKYIWRRGRKTSQAVVGDVTIDESQTGTNATARCLTAILQTEGISMDVEGLLTQGETPKQILTEALSDDKVIDLTGCNVEQVLYYVNLKTPVYAVVNNEAMLIVGYDEHNTILYNPDSNTTYKVGLQDSNAMFEAAGNVFLGYLK